MNYPNNTQNEWNEVAKLIAAEGVVLLKNDNNVLPIGNEKIALFGATGERMYNALLKEGVDVDKELFEKYYNFKKENIKHSGYSGSFVEHSTPEMPIDTDFVLNVKNNGAKKAFIVINRASFENSDMKNEVGDYILRKSEINMIKEVCSVFDSVVLLLEIGCNIDLAFLDENKIDGILYINRIGNLGAISTAQIIIGKINPSGKLTHSISKYFNDYSSSKFFGQAGGGIVQDYYEDIYIGYRYFDTIKDADKNLLYPFGFGLSYTDFKLEKQDFKINNEKIELSVKVTNIGKMPGKEVVQVYYSVPKLEDNAKLSGPNKQLIAFKKTKLLDVNESQVLNLEFNINDMASYDDLGVLGESSCFVLEKGTYNIYLGNSSRSLEKYGHYEVLNNTVTKKCHKIITSLPHRLTASGTYEQLPPPPQDDNRYHSILGKIELSSKESVGAKNFSSLKKGESITFKIMPASGGLYDIGLKGSSENFIDLFSAYIDNQEVEIKKGSIAKIVLPFIRCELTLKAKKDIINVTSLVLEKSDCTYTLQESNVINADNYYECSYDVDILNYNLPDGQKGSVITRFYTPGKNVTFKLNVKEAGEYDLSFKYSYMHQSKPLSKVISIVVSNIAAHVNGAILDKTYTNDREYSFSYSPVTRLELPKGEIYLKIVSENKESIDIAQLIINKAEGEYNYVEAEEKESKEGVYVWAGHGSLEEQECELKGIQLKDVYKDRSKIDAYLQEFTNEELAMLLSGTGKNNIKAGIVGCNHPIPSKGVPACQTADHPHFLALYGLTTTIYPTSLVLASTFNLELVELMGNTMAKECTYYGVDFLLGPSMNIFRSPAGGRNSTYYSEDPYLSGIVSAAYIKGVNKEGIVPVLKHYLCNSTEFERLKSNSRVSERAIREIYAKSFEITIKNVDVPAIMSSYNLINDTKVCEDYTIITEIPRNEWNFEGVFMTDWWNSSDHVSEIKAGHDIKMATGDVIGVTKALDEGVLKREDAYKLGKRVINTLFKIKRVQKLLEQ